MVPRTMVATVALAIGMALVTTSARAQSRLPSVVQLPTFRFFSYSGTVVVPDSGAAYLGGNKTSSIGSQRRGLHRGLGLSRVDSQASIHATIIDHQEMDRQLLGGSPEQFLKANRTPEVRAAADPDAEGKSLVRYARKMYQKGDEAGSFDAYMMAIEVLDGRLEELAKVEFRKVFGSAADQSLRMAALHR